MKHLIVGFGITGQSVARFLDAEGTAYDIYDDTTHQARIDICDYARVVASPGVANDHPLLQHANKAGIAIINDVTLFYEALRARGRLDACTLIGVTGSNGKSTVSMLLAHTLNALGISARACGNIGVPLLDLLEDTPDVLVVELSSYQLERMGEVPFAVGALLNISPDHMDRYASLADYAAAKIRLLKMCRAGVVANSVLADYRALLIDGNIDTAALATFGARQNADIATDITTDGDAITGAFGAPIALANPAIHPLNAAAVIAILTCMAADIANTTADAIARAFASFEGLPHRMQSVRTYNGVRWINDSKATNIGAMVAAVERAAMHNARLILLIGGDAKGVSFAPVAALLRDAAAQIFCWGKDSAPIATQLCHANLTQVADMNEAVARAAAIANHGDTVLLAPGCASTDMFRNFSERGKAFSRAVMAL